MAGEGVVTVTGRIKADPKVEYIGHNGTAVLNFAIASQSRVKDKRTNEWVDGDTTWYECTAWGAHAENIASTVTKGFQVLVTGRIKMRTYDRPDGKQGKSLSLAVNDIGILIPTYAPRDAPQTTDDSDVPF